MNIDIFKCQKYITNSLFIKKALSLKLTLEEFLMLTYFDNDYSNYLNIEELSKNIGISTDKAYEVFTNLLSKKIIDIKTEKDIEGRLIEKISLDNFYQTVLEEEKAEEKEEIKTDIYKEFENEFARPITSMEYEIINAWLSHNYSEELIKGALKEAVYNGVKNLRYIDKILFEWNKKGFKSMNDVNNHLQQRNTYKKEENELFDYNWLEDEE